MRANKFTFSFAMYDFNLDTKYILNRKAPSNRSRGRGNNRNNSNVSFNSIIKFKLFSTERGIRIITVAIERCVFFIEIYCRLAI